jgi:hypothetical protein
MPTPAPAQSRVYEINDRAAGSLGVASHAGLDLALTCWQRPWSTPGPARHITADFAAWLAGGPPPDTHLADNLHSITAVFAAQRAAEATSHSP